MASLSSLNSYSTTDTTYQIATQYLTSDEGGNVMMPLLTWNPVHDIGNTLAGNGVEITHTLTTGNIILSNGYSMNLTAFNSWTAPVTPTANITYYGNEPSGYWPRPSTNFVKYNTRSIEFFSSSDKITVDHSGVYNKVNTGDFCWETYLYADQVSVSTYYFTIVDYSSPSANGWSLRHRRAGPSGEELLIKLNDTNTTIALPNFNRSLLDQWRHICVQRNAGVFRVYIDGTKIYEAAFTASVPATNPQVIGQLYNTAAFTNFGYYYYDQVRYSNVVRYAGTNTITPPTALLTVDGNTIYMVEATSAVTIAQVAIQPYATNAVIDWTKANITTPKANTGGHTQVSRVGNVYTISNIVDVEDYLNADTYVKFDNDYYGTGNINVGYGTATWSTQIRNTAVATYDYKFDVNCRVYNSSEFDKTSLANIYYQPGNVVNLTDAQTAYISDTLPGNSTITISTTSPQANIVLDTTSSVGVTKTWTGNATSGQLSLTGSKIALNASLANLTFLGNNASISTAMTFMSTGNIITSSTSSFANNPENPWIPKSYFEGSVIMQLADGSTEHPLGPMLISLPNNANTSPVFAQMTDTTKPITLQWTMLDATVEYGYNIERIVMKLNGSLYLLSRGGYWYWSRTFPSNQPANTGYLFNPGAWHDFTLVRTSGSNNSYIAVYHSEVKSNPKVTLMASLQSMDGWSTQMTELTFGDYSAPGVVFMDELRISNTARADRIPATVAGYRQPRPNDASTMAVWRFCSMFPNATLSDILTSDTTRTIYDSGTMTWRLTNASGLQTTLTQRYSIQGT